MLCYRFQKLSFVCVFFFLTTSCLDVSAQEEPSAADKRKVSVLMRLKHIDVNEKPELKQSVIRVLSSVQDDSEFLNYAKRFKIKETNERLWKIVEQSKDNNNRASAMDILLEQNESDAIRERITDKSAEVILEAIGLVSNGKAIEFLKPLLLDRKLRSSAKNIVAKGLGRQLVGQKYLLELVNSDQLPPECEFTVANILLASSDQTIKEAASQKMKLPATKGSKPLAPITELVTRRGEVANGQAIFLKQGTCANCHVVKGIGKEVGPDLSEIGSKLSRQAMYESILNPSAAVSHNYETYLAQTIDGLLVTGVLISETDDSVTLRTQDALTKVLAKEDLDGMRKKQQSLMPNDLQQNFSESDLVDLVEYLMTLKKK